MFDDKDTFQKAFFGSLFLKDLFKKSYCCSGNLISHFDRCVWNNGFIACIVTLFRLKKHSKISYELST